MIIYGVALLSFCMLTGLFIGNLLGSIIGVSANVGGVGIAMLMLLFLLNFNKKIFNFNVESKKGIIFWSAMYIPIIVAMAAKSNVVAAVSSGPVAILAGALAVFVSFALIPVLTKMAKARTAKALSPKDKGPGL
jgi:malonate transporter MadL subunit|tara:strand:- start:205 stop:606 length:402 start_codon:yes stop_codon:yes gene_type:complete